MSILFNLFSPSNSVFWFSYMKHLGLVISSLTVAWNKEDKEASISQSLCNSWASCL